MSTSKNAKRRIQQQSAKRKWPIVLSLIGVSTIMTGAGIGIGYAIFHEDNRQYDISFLTPNTRLENVGDIVGVQIKFRNSQPNKSKDVDNTHAFVTALDATAQELFENGTIGFCDPTGAAAHDQLIYQSSILVFRDKNPQAFYIQLYKPSNLEELSYLVKLKIQIYFGDDEASQIQSDYYINLVNNDASPSPTDPERISNTTYKLSDIAEYDSDVAKMYANFKANFISATGFTDLPKLQTKINLKNYTYGAALEELHKYDNVESIVSLLLLDYFWSWADYTVHSTQIEYDAFKLVVYDIIKDTPDQETGAQLFNMYFHADGTAGTELPDTSFSTIGQNWAGDWSINWNFIYEESSKEEFFDQTGYAQINNSPFCNSILQIIYKDVVSTWPDDWIL